MAIPEWSAFDYEAEFTDQNFRGPDILLRGGDRGGGEQKRLVGPRPDIRLDDDLLLIFTSEERLAHVRHASFPVGDAVSLTARPGDRLYVCRDAAGYIGLSLLRAGKLVLAVGVVTAVPLGEGVRAARSWDGSWEEPSKNTRLEFSAGAERVTLRGREFSRAGEYHVYVERGWAYGVPGGSACAAVWAGDDTAMWVAALRSAVLLGHGVLKLVGWDDAEWHSRLK